MKPTDVEIFHKGGMRHTFLRWCIMWQSGIDMKVPYNLMLRTLVIYVVFEGDLYSKLGIIAVHKTET